MPCGSSWYSKHLARYIQYKPSESFTQPPPTKPPAVAPSRHRPGLPQFNHVDGEIPRSTTGEVRQRHTISCDEGPYWTDPLTRARGAELMIQ